MLAGVINDTICDFVNQVFGYIVLLVLVNLVICWLETQRFCPAFGATKWLQLRIYINIYKLCPRPRIQTCDKLSVCFILLLMIVVICGCMFTQICCMFDSSSFSWRTISVLNGLCAFGASA